MSCEIALYMSAAHEPHSAMRDSMQEPASGDKPGSERGQATLQVLDQIFDILDPNRQAQHPVAYADRRALLRRETLMGRGRGMGDQALRVAEIVGNVDDFERVGEAERS